MENNVTITSNDGNVSTKEMLVTLGVTTGIIVLSAIPVMISSHKAKKERKKFEKHKEEVLKSRNFLEEIDIASIQNNNIVREQKAKVYEYLMEYYYDIKFARDIDGINEALEAYERFFTALTTGSKDVIDIRIQIECNKKIKAEKQREIDNERRKEDREFNKEMQKCNMIVDAIKAQHPSSPNTVVNVGDRNVK